MLIEYDYNLAKRFDSCDLADRYKKFVETKILFSFLGNGKSRRSLDVGTLTGRYLRLLQNRGYWVCGIDVSPVIRDIRIYSSSCQCLHLCQMSAFQMGFRDSTFDLVICMMGTFAHFAPALQEIFLQQASRILNMNGILVISTWNPLCSECSTLQIYADAQRQWILDNSISDEELAALLSKVGFSELSTVHFNFLSNKTVTQEASRLGNLSDSTLLEALGALELKLRMNSASKKQGQMFMTIARKIELRIGVANVDK